MASSSSSWHIQTTRDSATNVVADAPPVFSAQTGFLEFSKDNQTVFVIPREHVLYIKKLPT
jgi:hypothetical protein